MKISKKLYKKLGVNPAMAKPGDLMMARNRMAGMPMAKKHRKHHKKHKMTEAQDNAYDAKHGIKEGSKRDEAKDAKQGIMDKKRAKTHCKTCGKKHEKSHAHFKKRKIHKKNWIANAISKPVALHRQLGVKQGTKIPASKLANAASKGGKLGQRARLAETLKGLRHKK